MLEGSIRVLVENVFDTHCLQDNNTKQTVWSRDKDIKEEWRKLKWCKALQFVLLVEYYEVKSKQYDVQGT
jgi:hypothetical protein